MKRNEKEKWNSRRNTLDRRHMIWFFSMFMLTSFFFLPIQFWVNVSKVYVVRTWFPCMTPKKREMRYHLDHNHTNWEKRQKEKWPYKKSHWRKNRSFSRSSFISTASLFSVLSLLPFFSSNPTTVSLLVKRRFTRRGRNVYLSFLYVASSPGSWNDDEDLRHDIRGGIKWDESRPEMRADLRREWNWEGRFSIFLGPQGEINKH